MKKPDTSDYYYWHKKLGKKMFNAKKYQEDSLAWFNSLTPEQQEAEKLAATPLTKNSEG